MVLETMDLVVVAFYAVLLFGIAIYVSREPKGHVKTTEDYFLAGKSLPWWAIGASLIAANISAEQIIGMSGEGYRIGLAIAAYEWQAAIVLILVAKYFLPIFLKREVYTMPQFLDQRFGTGVKTTMSIYWIALYTLVNLTAVLWLGAIAVNSLTGVDEVVAMAGMGTFAIAYSIFGGLKAVALTDIIQVVILIVGGIIIAVLTMQMIGGGNFFGGVERLYTELPEKFDMIFEPGQFGYDTMPGIWTLLGGLWILHLNYWGFNQYIIQRALGAKDLPEAQKGLVFAAALKLIMPLIIVLPGIAAVMLAATEFGALDQSVLDAKTDAAYPEVMGIMPAGLRGLIFAALVAAIVSSLASMVNSISTIFTMDIYKPMIKPGQTEHHYVSVGRFVAVLAMVIAVIAAKPFLAGFDSAFQTIQEYTGFIAPGVVAVFLLGMFYKPANSEGAFTVLILSVLLSIVLKVFAPELSFVNRIWLVFLLSTAAGMAVSHMSSLDRQVKMDTLIYTALGLGALVFTFIEFPSFTKPISAIFVAIMVGAVLANVVKHDDTKLTHLEVKDVDFKTKSNFNIAALLIGAVLIGLYWFFW
ncbi:MAG: sodium/solute symporter [Hellea sp.]|nr:sodium/solute symporter [Hellea sp.]